jgi:phosphatidate cytidylyltransferase
MGTVLIALTLGVLLLDQGLAPWYPFLLLLVLLLTLIATFELLQLLGPQRRPAAWLCYTAVGLLILANWLPGLLPELLPGIRWKPEPWTLIAGVFAAVVLAAFLSEMAVYRAPGEAVTRISLTVWLAAYLGLLPSFLVQLRWLSPIDESDGSQRASTALALAIFVPKCCDIGAYFAGRLFGRRPLAPVLSPKKTWEGAVGGLALSAAAAGGINQLGPAVRHGWLEAAALGLVLGLAGLFGDLAESLIKRDCLQKDASQVVPGFGGVLDVVDAILFAAPVSYWWLR